LLTLHGVHHLHLAHTYKRVCDSGQMLPAASASGKDGLRRTITNDTWMYGVIGVQSTWFANQRIVAFCPWSTFAAELEREILSAREA